MTEEKISSDKFADLRQQADVATLEDAFLKFAEASGELA